jgi:tRNA G26 N,N-dimethylase Trm1
VGQHAMVDGAGPLWTGSLWNAPFVAKMAKKNTVEENQSFLDKIAAEAKVDAYGIYHIHALAKKHNLASLPKQAAVIEKILKKKKKVSATHLDPVALRSTMSEEEFVKVLKD